MSELSSNDQPYWMSYAPGKKNDVGEEIDFIYAQSIRFIVYTIKPDNRVRWEYESDLCPNYEQANALYNAIWSRSKSIVPKRKKSQFISLIISDLIKALIANESIPQEKLFQESIKYIDTICNDKAHFSYIATSLITTSLSVIPALLYASLYPKDTIYQVLAGGFFGSCGAFVSVLQRFDNIIVPKYSTWRFTFLRALSKILIGCIFGGLFVIANKSGVVLNLVNTSSFIVYAFSFMCGLSERLFPDLMNKAENSLEYMEFGTKTKD